MKWTLNQDLSRLDGTQKVMFANRTGKPLNEVYFRLFANYPGDGGGINVTAVRISGRAVADTLQAQNTVLRVPLSRSLNSNSIVQIDLDYTIQIPTNNPVRYNEFTRNDWITTLPTVYPLIPAFDDKGWHLEVPPPYGDLLYADSSIYDVSITTPAQYNVIASGELVSELTRARRLHADSLGRRCATLMPT